MLWISLCNDLSQLIIEVYPPGLPGIEEDNGKFLAISDQEGIFQLSLAAIIRYYFGASMTTLLL